MNYLEIIEEAKREHKNYKVGIILALKRYIEAEKACRKNPCGWRSLHGPKEDPIWAEYYKLQDELVAAEKELWYETEMEYGNCPIINACWDWRYWRVMSRKCCWYQKNPLTDYKAAETMRELDHAEYNMVRECGLLDIYKSSSEYIEEAFPKLKGGDLNSKKKPFYTKEEIREFECNYTDEMEVDVDRLPFLTKVKWTLLGPPGNIGE